MKYLLIITTDPEIWETLSPEERNEVIAAHDRFQTLIVEPGELCSSVALADPSNARTVRVRQGEASVTDAPYMDAKQFVGGYYLVECDTVERATELAAAIPDARLTAVEVRPLMHVAGLEM
jgi:hypothetical protein